LGDLSEKIEIVSLHEKELPSSFDCGDDSLNQFLLESAQIKHKTKESFVYLALLENNVVGYVALATGSVRDTKLKRVVPSVLIGRLAVIKDHKRLKIGKKLILWSLSKARQVSERVACRYVYVDVLENSEAFEFYDAIGFDELKGTRKKSKEYEDSWFQVMYVDLAAE
jgi:predicted N-acetyltransferase YhbS